MEILTLIFLLSFFLNTNVYTTCPQGLYGNECLYCEDGVSCFGNGICGDDGICVCDSGWGWDGCSIPCDSESCVYGCDVNGCVCPDGKYGEDCSIECECDNGRCNEDGACVCHNGYYGATCSKQVVCPAGSSVDGQECLCNIYDAGPDCRVSCLDCVHGVCTEHVEGICTCYEGWYGPLCDTNVTCGDNGVPYGGGCVCYEGWYGPECDVECEAGCSYDNRTQCDGEGGCECIDGLYGPECDRECFSETTCNGNGVCNENGTCDCYLGYYGEDCHVECSYNTTCNGNGVCNENGTCECGGGPGYFHWCEDRCDDAYCNNHGTCKEYVCECEHNYAGEQCEYKCDPDDWCYIGGTQYYAGRCTYDYTRDEAVCGCVDGDGVYPCGDYCDDGWVCSYEWDDETGRRKKLFCQPGRYGDSCEYMCLSDITCLSRGICESDGNCSCFPGHYGANCERSCEEACGVNAFCYGDECVCRGGWRGVVCNETIHNEGECGGFSYDGICSCMGHKGGSFCMSNATCMEHNVSVSQDGKCICGSGDDEYLSDYYCAPYFEANDEDCVGRGGKQDIPLRNPRDQCRYVLDDICSGRGYLVSDSCVCQGGYYGPNCTQWCSHGNIDGSDRCTCDPGWYGPECDVECQCGPGECNSVGRCLTEPYPCAYQEIENVRLCQSDGSMQCLNNLTGPDCLFECTSNDQCAFPHGVCFDGACICERPYTGHNCSSEMSKCLEGAAYGHNDTCICPDGLSGDYCNMSTVQDCHGHGTISKDDQCICFGGYSGPQCSDNRICSVSDGCFNVSDEYGMWCMCEADTCVHGIINMSTSTCQCYDGWSGSECSAPVSQCNLTLCDSIIDPLDVSADAKRHDKIICMMDAYPGEDVYANEHECYEGEWIRMEECSCGVFPCNGTCIPSIGLGCREQSEGMGIHDGLAKECYDNRWEEYCICNGVGCSNLSNSASCYRGIGCTYEYGGEEHSLYCSTEGWKEITEEIEYIANGCLYYDFIEMKCHGMQKSVYGWYEDSTTPCEECVHGICVDGVCKCNEDWYGTSCDLDCLDKCNGRGTCSPDGGCECYNGFVGEFCEDEFSSALNCSNHGYPYIINGKCFCDDTHVGGQCEYPYKERYCGIHGSFAPPHECFCAPGFSKDDEGKCTRLSLCNPVTIVNGYCDEDEAVCDEGWVGWLCDVPEDYNLAPNTNVSGYMYGLGLCEENVNCFGRCEGLYNCVCDDEYYGPGCMKYCDQDKTCNGNGVCAEDGSCVCFDEYYGEFCERRCDNHSTCGGRGYCDDEGSCVCDEGLHGDHCDEKCFCNGHGICASNGSCVCHSGWHGEHCDIYCTSEVKCSDHGSCSWDGACVCDDGWQGAWCSCNKAVNCSGHGSCREDGGCRCDTRYALDDCSIYCSSGVSYGVVNGTCFCKSGQYGPGCGVHCGPDNCSGQKYCNDSGSCVCEDMYYGENCTDFCLNGVWDEESLCVCESGWHGESCDVFCDNSTCNGRGICGDAGDCICESGWFGDGCQIECDEAHTNGTIDGECCVCESGWYGCGCHIQCIDADCIGNGMCNGSGVCECESGWYSAYCNVSCSEAGEIGYDGNDCICDRSRGYVRYNGSWVLNGAKDILWYVLLGMSGIGGIGGIIYTNMGGKEKNKKKKG